MAVPKKSHARLLSKLHSIYPDIAKLEKELLNIDDIEPDTQSLLDPPLKYEKTPPADLVIKNASLPGREKENNLNVAVKDNLIVEVGDAEEIKPFLDAKTAVIDAKGGSVLPGFCDSHLHLLKGAQHLSGCDMEGVEKADEFKKRLGDFIRKNPDEPVVYVYGVHYFDPPLIPAETARHFLDTIIKDKPLLVFAHDLHTAWANTKALEISDLLRKMPPYPPLIEILELDGNIVLGEDEIPSGEFREPEVYYLVEGKLRAKFPQPLEKQLENLRRACGELSRLGFTSVHRMGLSHPVEDISFLLLAIELEQRKELPLRIYSSISAVADVNMLEDVHQAHQIRRALDKARAGKITAAQLYEILFEKLKQAGGTRHGAVAALAEKYRDSEDHPLLSKIENVSNTIRDLNWKIYIDPHQQRGNIYRKGDYSRYLNPDAKVKCDTVKIFMDGVIEKDTAYRRDREPAEGLPEFTSQHLDLVVGLADRLGMQVSAHSIGNASVKSMLDAISRARRKHRKFDEKRGHRIPHRIEHIEMCEEEDIPRFAKHGVVASMQPLHARPPLRMWHKKVPRKNWDTAFPWKELRDNGAVLIYGSDWPIVSCDVRKGTHHACTRKPWTPGGRVQRVDTSQALDAYTRSAAFAEYASNIKGSIEPGMLADIVVLSGQFSDLAEENPPEMDIRATICDGKVVYESEKNDNGGANSPEGSGD